MPISKQAYPRPNPLLLSSFLPLGVQPMMGQTSPAFLAPIKRPAGPALLPVASSGAAGLRPAPQHLTGTDLAGRSSQLPSSSSGGGEQAAQPAVVVVKQEDLSGGHKLCVSFLRLEIGGYECKSKTPGDLQAQFDFGLKRLLWEVVSGGARLSINSSFDEVAGFGLEMLKDGSAVLTIEFSRPPKVSWEGETQFPSFLFAKVVC
jgi:hypothetical protein